MDKRQHGAPLVRMRGTSCARVEENWAAGRNCTDCWVPRIWGAIISLNHKMRRRAELERQRSELEQTPKEIRSYFAWSRPAEDDREVWVLTLHGQTQTGQEFSVELRVCQHKWKVQFMFSDGTVYRFESQGQHFDTLSRRHVRGAHSNLEAATGESYCVPCPELQGFRFTKAFHLICARMSVSLKYRYRQPPGQTTMALSGGDDCDEC